MLKQPFYIHGNLLLFCMGGPLVVGCSFSQNCPTNLGKFLLPNEPPCDYIGIAFFENRREFLFLDTHRNNVIVSSLSDCNGQKSIEICDLMLRPRSITYAYDYFWLTLTKGDFETIIAKYDPQISKFIFLDLKSKFGFGELNLLNYPLVMACQNKLVAYDNTNTLLWLNNDCSVIKSVNLSIGAVLGPAANNNLLVLEKKNNTNVLSMVDFNDDLICINKLKLPCENVAGIAMTLNNNIIIQSESDNSIYYTSGAEKWENIDIPTTSMLWDTYLEREKLKVSDTILFGTAFAYLLNRL